MSRRLGVSLRLVTEKQDAQGEHVHVQTMATRTVVLPAYDPTVVADGELWNHADRDFKLPDESVEARAARATAARNELRTRIGGQATALLIGHLATRAPRATRGSAGEDAAGSGDGHINGRHVLGQSRDPAATAPAPLGGTVSRDWLAYRAACNVPKCGGFSGGFDSPAAASSAIQQAFVLASSDWTKLRMELFKTGSVQTILPVVPSGICFVRIDKNANSATDLPTWLGGTTNRKLHPGDANAVDVPALTDSGPPVGTEIRIKLGVNAPNGWFIHSAWPTAFI